MNLHEKLKYTPKTILTMGAVFALLPVILGFYLPFPWETASRFGLLVALVQIILYSICPYLLLATLFKRHIAAIPLYILQTVAIALYLSVLSPFSGIASVLFNLVLVLSIFGGGILLLSNDFLMPMLSRHKRLWRTKQRLAVHRLVKLRTENSKQWHSYAIRNISKGGLCLVAFPEAKDSGDIEAGRSIEFEMLINNQKIELDGLIHWVKDKDDNICFGIECYDKKKLFELFELLPELKISNILFDRIFQLSEQPQFRQILTGLWICSVLISSFLPACGKKENDDLKEDEVPAIIAAQGGGGSSQKENSDERIKVPFSLSSGEGTSDVEDYKISITGCDSGYEDVFEASDERPYIKFSENDRGCDLNLEYLVIGGKKYLPILETSDWANGVSEYISESKERVIVSLKGGFDGRISSELNSFVFVVLKVRSSASSGGNSSILTVPDPQIVNLTVQVDQSKLIEKIDDHVLFKISADELLLKDVNVKFHFIGSAELGKDFSVISELVVIPAGENTVLVDVEILDDQELEANETIELEIVSGAGYIAVAPSASAMLYDDEYPDVTPALLDVNSFPVGSYGAGQDAGGTIAIDSSNGSVKLVGNTWKALDMPYVIKADTVLAFDFSSTNQGEVHGIGFDTDLNLSPETIFKLYGTQAWGIGDYEDYLGYAPQTKHYEIPVGKFFTGPMKYLVFAMDHDVSGASGNSIFANIQIYETSSMAVLPAHLNPPVAKDDMFAIAPNSELTSIDVLANDAADEGEVIMITSVSDSSDGGRIELVNETELHYAPKAEFVGFETFTYEISDGFSQNRAIGTVTILVTSVTPLNFNNFTFSSYDNSQDLSSQVNVVLGGVGFEISGNGWKKIPINYVITKNTILEFDFKSDRQGEVQGIGFDNMNSINAAKFFKLYGTQDWGIKTYFNYGPDAPNLKHYKIPVGQVFTGSYSFLTFGNDHDAAPANANSIYLNMRLYEQE